MVNEKDFSGLLAVVAESGLQFEKAVRAQIGAVLDGELPDFNSALLSGDAFAAEIPENDVIARAVGLLPGVTAKSVAPLAQTLIDPLLEHAKSIEFVSPEPPKTKIKVLDAIQHLEATGHRVKIIGGVA